MMAGECAHSTTRMGIICVAHTEDVLLIGSARNFAASSGSCGVCGFLLPRESEWRSLCVGSDEMVVP